MTGTAQSSFLAPRGEGGSVLSLSKEGEVAARHKNLSETNALTPALSCTREREPYR